MNHLQDMEELAGGNPAVRSLVGHVMRKIDQGTLREGDRIPSIRELAHQHRVSLSTARTALDRLHRVGLVERLHGSGTYLRQRAAVARAAESRTAYLYLERRAHLAGDLPNDLVAALHPAGIVPLIVSWCGIESEQDRARCRTWDRDPPRAVVLQGLADDRDVVMRRLASLGTRIITIAFMPQLLDPAWHSVTPDFFNAYRTAAEHALKLGHCRIGLVLKPRLVFRGWRHSLRKALMTHSQQILGAGSALRTAGLHNALTIHYNHPVQRDPSGIPVDQFNVDRMSEWLSGPNRPTAVIGDDYRMLGVRLAALSAGLKVPDDLLLIGVGGTFLAHSAEMPTVNLRYDLIARQVARLITADEKELGGSAQHITVPPMLLDRSPDTAS